MTRINISDVDGHQTGQWFDMDSATEYREDQWHDGSNLISSVTASQWHHEDLYRTAGGRWVLNAWSNYEHVPATYRLIGDKTAHKWLKTNGHWDSVPDDVLEGAEV